MQDRIGELRALHHFFNQDDFSGVLSTPYLFLSRTRNRDGYYEYRAHRDWTPIRQELKRASITISEWCWEENTMEGTLLHEMIHQYQAEILDEAPHHNEVFHEMVRSLEDKYGFEIE